METATERNEKDNHQVNPLQVDITYYTDPLCCWSWALQPAWSRLLQEHRHDIAVRYVMGCMIVDWKSYNDPVNIVSRPFQMGPVWMHAATITGVPMRADLWHTDPPQSSYPACCAVKCAALQSPVTEEKMLYALREAVMKYGLNIGREGVIFETARTLERKPEAEFSASRFLHDWKEDRARKLVVADLDLTRRMQVDRFPTLTLKNSAGELYKIVGFRPYEVLLQTIRHVQDAAHARANI